MSAAILRLPASAFCDNGCIPPLRWGRLLRARPFNGSNLISPMSLST